MINKYVLLVDTREGGLTSSAAKLKALGYDVALAEGLEAALAAIASLDRLSLVVVDCQSTNDDYQQFLASVRGMHPHLPVIWLTDTQDVVLRFLKQPVDVARESHPRELGDSAARLLYEEFYASNLVQEVSDAAQQVLGEFGFVSKRSEPYIKSNLTLLSDVNALIGFSGDGLSGHLILSASAGEAFAMYRAHAPEQDDPQSDDLEDLLGEVTNRVLGRIKRVFEARGLSFKLKAPAFIRGPQARYRNKASTPSLAIEFAEHGGLLRLEFCVDRMNAVSPSLRPDAEFIQSGQITFL